MELRTLYQDLSDFLVYVESYAPNFPPADEITTARAFEKLFWWIGEIREREQNKNALDWLSLCSVDIAEARVAYIEKKNTDLGYPLLHSASRYLDNAKRRKPHRVDFFGDSSGTLHKNTEPGGQEPDTN